MIRPIAFPVLLGALACGPFVALAQDIGTRTPPTAVTRALETITERNFRAKLDALAHDSTRGRETPSPELERATEWVAAQFRNAGLAPAGDDRGFLQRFHIRTVQIDSLTVITVSGREYRGSWALGDQIVYAVGGTPSEIRDAPAVLLTGIPSEPGDPFGDAPVRGAVLLHVIAPDQLSGRVLNPVHQAAQEHGALAHIVATEIPDELWTEFRQGSFPSWWEVSELVPRMGNLVLAVYGLQLAGATDLLRAAGEDPVALLQADTFGIRVFDGYSISVAPHTTVRREAAVANVVGLLEGSDLALREEAVVFTSHIDHVGVIPGRCQPSEVLPADSICNGADDNASGTVGVIELAEAFAGLDRRPARTLIFAAVTAEERGLFGSLFYVEHPVVPPERTVAVINLDMIARNPPDTVGFLGKDYTSLGGLVDRFAAEHSELHLAPTEHQGRYTASDHYPFAERGVPALFFFSGEHDDLHTAADNPERADAGQAARIARLAFFVGLKVANAVERPVWGAEARARVVRQ